MRLNDDSLLESRSFLGVRDPFQQFKTVGHGL